MKKTLLILNIFIVLIFLFSFSKVLAADANLKDAAQGTVNTVENVVSDAGHAINKGASTVKNATGNVMNANKATATTNNYNATRTSTTSPTFMGMNATAWTWLIVGVLGAIIIGLVWYYGKEHSSATKISHE